MRKAAFQSVVCIPWLSLTAGLFAAQAPAAKPPTAPPITVTVDPRVELMSIIFRLAGNGEYNQGKVPSYVQDVDSHFGKFRDHAVVNLAKKLRQTQGVSFDAVMGMAVHMTDAVSLQEKIPFSPPPSSLDRRWTPETAREFLTQARQFVGQTKFQEFFDKHQPLYQVATQRMQEVLDKHAHLEWFDKFFGPRPGADFRVVLGMLNGSGCYGVHLAKPDGQEELYSIIGVEIIDTQGQPTFPTAIAPIIVHEFTHSYTNRLVDQFAQELQSAGEKIFPLVADEMRKQAYGNWKTMMRESLNRACGLRYMLATRGLIAMQGAATYETSRSFYWVGDLTELLGEYEAEPRQYKDLAQFFPKIIAFFDDYAKNADTKLGALKTEKEKQSQPQQNKGPKIVSMVPANGAQDVDPKLKAIVVTFDRPMRDKSWSVTTLGPQDQYPKTTGPLRYDGTRRVFTMPVELEPGKEYVFGLNSQKFQNFRSAEGIPLTPVAVRFKTKAADKE
jgi:hypothetical protein